MFFIVIDGSIEKLLNYSTIIIVFRLPSLSMYPNSFFTCLPSTTASSPGTISLVTYFKNHLLIHQPSQLINTALTYQHEDVIIQKGRAS